MATTTRLTLEQFLALEETEPASEFIRGEVIQKAMPTFLHGMIQRLLSAIFTRLFDVEGSGDGGSEVRCIFGPPGEERAFVPDFVYIVEAQLPADPAALSGPFRGAPDLAVEILSPDDRPTRVMEKIDFYLRHGVRLVWLIDPLHQTVTVFSPTADAFTLHREDVLEGGAVIPGFSVPVDDLFPRRGERRQRTALSDQEDR